MSQINMIKKKKYSTIIRSLLLAAVIVVVLRISFWPVRVDGHSMEESLKHKQIIFISKIPILLGDYGYNDMVVVSVDDGNGSMERVVKRIVGLPGDHVVILEDQLYINGQVVVEPYRKGFMADDLDYYVPQGMYFILGDSRSVSRDSRNYGCIYKDQISETVLFHQE